MAFKINSLKLEDTAEMHLKDPETGVPIYDTEGLRADDESKPVIFHIYGKASKQYKKALESLKIKADKRGNRKMSLAESMVENVDFLVALSKSVDNMEYDGQAVDSPEVFRAMYSDSSLPWVAEQVTECIGSVEAFLQR